MTFSVILLKTERREIGQKFDAVSGQPFLKSGITLANFILSGNIPE